MKPPSDLDKKASSLLAEGATNHIQALPLQQLEALADALLDFSGPSGLANWLAEHNG
ncbi:DUF4351 domain-containing protein [Synechococcus sp. UW140]|uniref:DUF4351 domain-containing protein n=1 Tax=Synechococcus sp. UW140 TaxID=368503 RepID=UPI003138008D